MRTALILNPDAGLSLFAAHSILAEDRETLLRQTLQRWGIEPEVYYTTVGDPGQGIAAQLAEKQVELIVAVGGDGTIHAVAQGLIGSQSVLGIVPAGTMNNLARSLGIPENLEEACAILANGEDQPARFSGRCGYRPGSRDRPSGGRGEEPEPLLDDQRSAQQFRYSVHLPLAPRQSGF